MKICIAIGGALFLGACSAGGPQEDLIVSVRDAESRRPITGAVVKVETQEPRHPLSVSGVVRTMLGSEIPEGPEGTTDAQGVVRLTAYTQLPCTIVIAARGYGVQTFFFGDHPAHVTDAQWQSRAEEDALLGSGRLEARFSGE